MTDAPPTPPNQPPTANAPPSVGARPGATPYQTPAADVAPSTPKWSGLAIAGFILAFIPFVCLNVVGVILAVVALVKISNQPRALKGQGLAIAAIVIGVLWFVVGILAAIAIPSFLKFQARAKQSEAKANLKMIFVAGKSHFAETGKMGTSFEELGVVIEGGNIYTYYLGDSRIESTREHPEPLPPGVDSFVTPETGEFQAVAVSNIDSDATLDVWAINDGNELVNITDDTSE